MEGGKKKKSGQVKGKDERTRERATTNKSSNIQKISSKPPSSDQKYLFVNRTHKGLNQHVFVDREHHLAVALLAFRPHFDRVVPFAFEMPGYGSSFVVVCVCVGGGLI